MESRKKKNYKECSVCGDEAAFCFYGAIVCDSCRAFFRRSVIRAKQQVKCRQIKKKFLQNNKINDEYNSSSTTSSINNEKCNVSVSNRKYCSKCRMDKCIEVGMKKENVFNLKKVNKSQQQSTIQLDEKLTKNEQINYNFIQRINEENILFNINNFNNQNILFNLTNYIQSKSKSINLDCSLNCIPYNFTKEESKKLYFFSPIIDYVVNCQIKIPDNLNSLSTNDSIYFISKLFTNRLIYVFSQISPFTKLPNNIQCEICQLFVPFIFIFRSMFFYTLNDDKFQLSNNNNNFLNEISKLPPEIYFPLKGAGFKTNTNKIRNFLQKYFQVLQKMPSCLTNDVRMIIFVFICMFFQYLNQLVKMDKQLNLPYQLNSSISTDSICVNQLFKKLVTYIHGNDQYKDIITILPDLRQITELFCSLTLSETK